MKTAEEVARDNACALWTQIADPYSELYPVDAILAYRREILQEAAERVKLEYISSEATDGYLCEGDEEYNNGITDAIRAIIGDKGE